MTVQHMFSAASGVSIKIRQTFGRRRLASKFSDLCPRLVETTDGVAWTAANKIGGAPGYKSVFDNAHLHIPKKVTRSDVEWLSSAKGRQWIQDRDEVSGEVLYSLGDVWDMINASGNDEFIVACHSAYNDWLAELCAASPERFAGIAKIPPTGIKDATKELKRAAEDLSLRGAVIDVWPAGADCPPAMKECESFWEAAAALDVPISLYRPLEGKKQVIELVEPGMPPEYHLALNQIIYANIPDRHPNIRFVSLAPNAGWAPALFEQINEGYMRTASLRKVNLGNPDLYPSDYLRRFVWFVTQDDGTALFNRGYFGESHLLWGSFAFMGQDSVWPNTRELFERITRNLPEDYKKTLAHDVTTRLYGIANAERFTAAEAAKFDRYSLSLRKFEGKQKCPGRFKRSRSFKTSSTGWRNSSRRKSIH